MDSLSRQIDGYCERTDFTFWAEPVNAVTNAAFLVAALVGLWAAQRHRQTDWATLSAIALVAVIGIGSFLFHTFATRWAALADVVPILVFIVVYIMLAMRRFFGLARWLSVGIGLAFVAVYVPLRRSADLLGLGFLGGTASYLPAAIVLAGCAALLAVRRHPAGPALGIAVAIFAASMAFRWMDAPLCEAWPVGTHFLWHVLNGVLLGWLLVTMVRFGRRPGSSVLRPDSASAPAPAPQRVAAAAAPRPPPPPAT